MSDNALVLNEPWFPSSHINGYIQKVNSIPMLSAEEEFELATKFQKENDLKAAQKLIMAHLRFVAKIAKKYSGYGLPLDDLIQEGTIGLMRAVKRYKPTKLVRLATYALYSIKAEIQEYIIKNWRLVKIATTKAQRKLFFNLRKKKKKLGWMSQEERQSLADELGVPLKEVITMEQRLTLSDMNIFQPSDDENTSNINQVEFSILENSDNNLENDVINHDVNVKAQAVIEGSFNMLNPRMKKIIQERYFSEEKSTLDDLAEQFSISKERVRQLESEAINLMRENCRDLIG